MSNEEKIEEIKRRTHQPDASPDNIMILLDLCKGDIEQVINIMFLAKLSKDNQKRRTE